MAKVDGELKQTVLGKYAKNEQKITHGDEVQLMSNEAEWIVEWIGEYCNVVHAL